MDITLEIPPPALFEVFETKTVSAGMIHTIPGGTLQLGEMPLEKRTFGSELTFIPLMVTLGSGVAIHLFSSWLYEKLTHAKVERIRINRTEIEVTAEGITKIITESVETEHRN